MRFFEYSWLHRDSEKGVVALRVDQLMSGQLKSPTRIVSCSVFRESMVLSISY